MSEEILASSVIREYQTKYGLPVFVETGTAQAGTLQIVVNDGQFEEYHSAELDDEFYLQALSRFSDDPTVHLHHGESDQILARILPEIDKPCLFWLDAHWVGGENDVKGSHGETPVMEELEHIFNSGHDHVILVDDARLFGVEGNYPTLEEVYNFADGYGYQSELEDDIIRIVKS